jgi:hypothetical protein
MLHDVIIDGRVEQTSVITPEKVCQNSKVTVEPWIGSA